MFTAYVRPDVVLRTGSVRPEKSSYSPVEDAYRIARDFTGDPQTVRGQYAVATQPSMQVAPTIVSPVQQPVRASIPIKSEMKIRSLFAFSPFRAGGR